MSDRVTLSPEAIGKLYELPGYVSRHKFAAHALGRDEGDFMVLATDSETGELKNKTLRRSEVVSIAVDTFLNA